jgi:hypothetical protein
MAIHPLHTLGFEPIASTPRSQPRSLAELGFELAISRIASHGSWAVGARAEAAARKTARDPRLRPRMQQRMVRPQPVGAVDADSGRKIVQPTDSPAVNQALATDAMPDYTARLAEAIRHISGATLAATRDAKNPPRLAEKIEDQKQPAATISDYGAAQIAVDSPQAKDAVVAAVKRHFTVLREQDHFAVGDAEYHYRSYSLQVGVPNGSSEELQIVPREVFEANRQEHHDYKKVRNAELAGKSAGQAKAAARGLNDQAMERFNSRNGVAGEPAPSAPRHAWADRVVKGAVVKGSRVRLADGAVAKVVYVDANMRIARVRTEDGRNITVRHKDLRSPG